jgi:hypothetical protein
MPPGLIALNTGCGALQARGTRPAWHSAPRTVGGACFLASLTTFTHVPTRQVNIHRPHPRQKRLESAFTLAQRYTQVTKPASHAHTAACAPPAAVGSGPQHATECLQGPGAFCMQQCLCSAQVVCRLMSCACCMSLVNCPHVCHACRLPPSQPQAVPQHRVEHRLRVSETNACAVCMLSGGLIEWLAAATHGVATETACASTLNPNPTP